jgi:hypothetical protein
MPSLIGSSLLRNVASFVAVLCVVLGGTWAAVHLTTNHLLYQNATAAARSWAQFLTANVTDLEQIAAGEKPSSASMAFFVHAQKSDQVFRYEIYDRSGFSLLVSDHNNDRVTIVDVSDFSLEAARSAKTAQPVVGTKEGLEPGQPPFFAQAFMPVTADGRVIAVVAAFVDQTEQRRSFNKVFLIAAASLCLFTGLSFAVPTVAWRPSSSVSFFLPRSRLEGRLWTLRSASEPSVGRPTARNGISSMCSAGTAPARSLTELTEHFV